MGVFNPDLCHHLLALEKLSSIESREKFESLEYFDLTNYVSDREGKQGCIVGNLSRNHTERFTCFQEFGFRSAIPASSN